MYNVPRSGYSHSARNTQQSLPHAARCTLHRGPTFGLHGSDATTGRERRAAARTVGPDELRPAGGALSAANGDAMPQASVLLTPRLA
jgi:hypothetical protein